VFSSDATAKLIRACMATAVLGGLLLVVWFVLGTSSPAWAATEPSHPVGARLDPATTSGAAGSTLSPSGRRAGHLRHRPMRAAQTAPVVADARAVLAVTRGVEPAGGDVFGDRGQDVASFPARTQHPLASPSDHDPQRPSSTPSSHGPGPLLPRGSSGPGTGPGRTGSTGNGGSSVHSLHWIGLAVLVRTCVLRSPREIRASFDSATFRHGWFLPSRLERPG